MGPRRRSALASIVVAALLSAMLAGCGSSPASEAAAPSREPVALSFDDYSVAFCSAWDSLFRAVGNPDTGAGSKLSDALDAAVDAHDGLAAERLATGIVAELETGRRFAAAARGWAPAAPMMTQMDRVFVAFEAMTSAKAAVAADAPGAPDPQKSLEGAGGVDAWTAMLVAAQSMARPPDAPSKPCATVPVTP